MKEEWRPIEGYEGLYEVSNLGRVRSLDRWVKTNPTKKPYIILGKIMSLAIDRDSNYYQLNLRNAKGTRKKHRIHNLVANAFLSKPQLNLIVCHGPNGTSDNSVNNLSWGTFSKNALDKQRDGTDYNINKTQCPLGHPLKGKNLIPSMLKKGRNCLACNRARSWLKYNDADFKYIADLCFYYDLPMTLIIEKKLI